MLKNIFNPNWEQKCLKNIKEIDGEEMNTLKSSFAINRRDGNPITGFKPLQVFCQFLCYNFNLLACCASRHNKCK